MNEFWIGTPDALIAEGVRESLSPGQCELLTDGSFKSDMITKWLGCTSLSSGETIFTLRAPREGDGSSSWTMYEDAGWAPECDLVVMMIRRDA